MKEIQREYTLLFFDILFKKGKEQTSRSAFVLQAAHRTDPGSGFVKLFPREPRSASQHLASEL